MNPTKLGTALSSSIVALTPASWRIFRRRFLSACLAAAVIMATTVVLLSYKVSDTLAGTKKITGLKFPDGPAQGGNYTH